MKVYVNSQLDFNAQDARNILSNFYSTGETVYSQRNEIKQFPSRYGALAVKSFKKPNIINRFIYGYFRKSKAQRSFEHSQKLLQLGVGVPKPYAYVEKRVPGLTNSYFIYQYIDNTFTLWDVLLDKVDSDKKVILDNLASLAYQLHSNDVNFLDLSPGNVLFSANDVHKMYLIDINRLRFEKLNLKARCRNFENLSLRLKWLNIFSKKYASFYPKVDRPRIIESIAYYHNKKARWRFRRGKLNETLHEDFGN